MFETVEFLLVIAVVYAIVWWYWRNVDADADGERGILALRPTPNIASRRGRRYRAQTQGAKARAYHERDADERAARRYRHQDDTRYRVKDRKAARRGL